ncbi:hypothetical protein NLI96_g12977 [Meripilus lineatus]|uniref:Major facilitator superfamily (MFS) profile domain-containing protein n=1 Tax=Meripilus lineatus TaxID=2056292 RepID=A0AAD5UST0_9APHY|nr:hypothetical protein NLI96_g12977 [Physisporinus lineatus]
MVFIAICLALFLAALEHSAVANILPTIVYSLHGTDFVWVSSAYSLAATCLIPTSGGFAEVLGRRPVILCAIGLFALGSALCGSAQNMTWLVAGRAIQGAGGGAIFSLSSIIISDFVPLRERGAYQGFTGLVWSVAAGIGPVVSGALATNGRWRWLFYLNLPISGLAFGLVLVFLPLRIPPGSFRQKISRLDWMYIQTFIAPISMFATLYFGPAYFQACFAASPIRSAVLSLSASTSIGPSVIISGLSIAITKRYRPQLWFGWILLVVGQGSLSVFRADTALGVYAVLPIVMSIGVGIIYAATYFPVLAPLPVTENAHALALFAYLRYFATVWGVTIGTAVFQNELSKRASPELFNQLPGGVSVVFSTIPLINSLPDELKVPLRVAFADSLDVIFQVMAGIAMIGLISSLFMEALPLHTQIDERWGLQDHDKKRVAVLP